MVQAREEAGTEEGVMHLGQPLTRGGGTEFASACGMKLGGGFRDLLAEVQGEEWLRFGEPNHEGCVLPC